MQLNEQAKSGGVPVAAAAAAQREKRVRPLKKLNWMAKKKPFANEKWNTAKIEPGEIKNKAHRIAEELRSLKNSSFFWGERKLWDQVDERIIAKETLHLRRGLGLGMVNSLGKWTEKYLPVFAEQWWEYDVNYLVVNPKNQLLYRPLSRIYRF